MVQCVFCKFGNFHEGFIFAKLRFCEVCENKTLKMALSLCRLLIMKSLKVANVSLNAILENKILAKISEFTVI